MTTTTPQQRWSQLALAFAAVATATLTACGGGGGGATPPPPPPPPPPAGVTIGGTLSVAANLVLDSDTNDPNQAPRRDNDFGTSQPITASSQVLGTVNLPGAGPAGASTALGDEYDTYTVTLGAGQTLELDFTADPDVNDVDLYVLQEIGGALNIVGESIGTSASECITISSPGAYTIAVNAFDGASLYNLRVTAAGATSSCLNATTSAAVAQRVRPGELVVGLRADSAKAVRAGAQLAGRPLRVQRGAVAAGRLALLALDDGAAPRARTQGAAASRAARLQHVGADSRRLLDTIAQAKQLRASGAFDQVMLNRVLHASALVGTFPPNDPRYPLQRWHYEQIALPAAMQRLAGLAVQPTVRPIVAVIDTGIVTDHPDLAPQLVPGFDFISSAASAGDGNGIDNNPDDLRVPDSQPSFHGTHVAGTVAASTFDGSGAAGVAPMAHIMGLRVLGEGGSGSFFDIAEAIRYASRQANVSGQLPARRADVINLSLGASGVACDNDSAQLFASVRAAGTLIVAATGNESNRPAGQITDVGYPANCPGVLAVTATDPQRGIAPYANTGATVAMAAPGGDMRTSTTGTGQPDGVYSTLATFDGSGSRVPTFGVLQGTSMATPHAAGVLALMRWVHPAITPAQVDTLLAQGALTDDVGPAGRDNNHGWGVINASKAVQAALTLRDGTAPPSTGVLEAQPSALDFGAAATALDFTVRATDTTTERVTATSTSNAAVTVAPVAVDTATGLGSYRITVNRSLLAEGVVTPTVTVQTTARTLTVALSIEKRAPGSTVGGDLGPVYVLVYDGDSGDFIEQVTVAAPTGGTYRYSLAGVTASKIVVVAGTDYDNDGIICARGEACGAYPVLGAQVTPVTLTGNRNDLGFVLSPVGAGNVQGAGLSLQTTPATTTAAGTAAPAAVVLPGRRPAAGDQNRLPKPTL
ncbi:S8 family serine peptidase [Rubrivivax sp. RP6-9]|uniref:S8 family serine peptidase n=1 Tax=Rubrivivax sp. RP6-9 TaxID=3415750 RepID=UPI003CC66F80